MWRILGFVLLVIGDFTHAQKAPIPVIVTTLEEKPFVQTIEALGTLKANEAITLTATVTDTIRAIHFDDGQTVKAGDVLAQMTSNEEHALLQAAKSHFSEAKQQLDRVTALAAKGLASEAELDVKIRTYNAAKAQWEATQSRLEDRIIVAPFDGQVGFRNISLGTLVRPGDSITTLDDTRTMKLDFTVPSVYMNTLTPGLAVLASSPSVPNQRFTGAITSINSRIDINTRSIKARAKLPNPNGQLKAGLLMHITIQQPERKELLIPEEALIQEGYKNFVYLVSNTQPLKVKKQEITTGPRGNGHIVATHGLNVGDKIVTHGMMRLRNGRTITIQAEQTAPGSVAEIIRANNGD